MSRLHDLPPFATIAVVCAAFAVVAIVAYLVRRPALTAMTKIWLLFALGVFPLGVAFAGNVQGWEASKQREFCGSCHVMTPYTGDAADRESASLAARHSRNPSFGKESCYVCHADYGMYGTVVTKLGGLGHVYEYYGDGYRAMTLAEARARIALHKPYDNTNCMQCHSTEDVLWGRVVDHRASLRDVRANRISCASTGCHGFAHPFTKAAPPAASGAAVVPIGGTR